jgi:hypothetical protein
LARYHPSGGQARREIEIAIWPAELPLEIAELPRRDPVAEDANHLL